MEGITKSFSKYKEELPSTSQPVAKKRKADSVINLYEYCTENLSGVSHAKVRTISNFKLINFYIAKKNVLFIAKYRTCLLIY